MQRNNLENMCITVQYIVSFCLVVLRQLYCTSVPESAAVVSQLYCTSVPESAAVVSQLYCTSVPESAAVVKTSQGEFQTELLCIRLQLTLFNTKSKM